MDDELVVGRGIAVVERLLVCQVALGYIHAFGSLGNNSSTMSAHPHLQFRG
jgi:hypothetical protein